MANEGKTTLDPKDTLRDEAANENVELEWMVSEWSNCTEEHSKTSFKTRTIECVAKLSNATRAVDSTFCEGAGLEAPSTWIKCEAELCQKASFIGNSTFNLVAMWAKKKTCSINVISIFLGWLSQIPNNFFGIQS